ncbi:hypothetical protein B7463_g8072, partial [Scytalidium lignicola]
MTTPGSLIFSHFIVGNYGLVSMNVKQNGDPPGSTPSANNQTGSLAPGQTSAEQPRCYNCGLEGHYVMGCPEPTRAIPAGLAAARAAGASHSAKRDGSHDGRHFQQTQSHRQRLGAVVTRYPVPKAAPVVTRYAVPPPPNAGYGASQGPYQQPYQQHAGQFTQPSMYQGNQGPPPNTPYTPYPPPQQYGGAGPQFQYSQAPGPNPYGNPAMQATPYGNQAYQTPPVSYNQYQPLQQPGPQGYPNPPQPYMPQPPAGPYQTPAAPYQPPNPNYGGGYGYTPPVSTQYQVPPSQWNHPPPAQPYNGPPYQQPSPSPYDPGYQTQPQPQPQPSYQAYPPQSQQPSQQGFSQGPQYGTYSAPLGSQIPQHQLQQERPRSAGSSRSSSIGHDRALRKPFFKRRDGSGSGYHSHRQYNQQQSTDSPKEHHGSQWYFDWELEVIFKEEGHSPAVPIALTLPNLSTEQPLYLGFDDPDNVVSRYVRPDNREEFKLSIRDTPLWDSVKDDPAFRDLSNNSGLIPFNQVRWWMEERHAKGAVLEAPTTQSGTTGENTEYTDLPKENTLKRARSPEKQLPNSPSKRLKAEEDYSPMQDEKNYKKDSSPQGYRELSPDVWASTTPVLNRSVTPSFGAEDDAWAPQPGESIASQSAAKDPTETLLASLGVSGEPKPVKDTTMNSLPDPYDKSRGPPPQRQDSGYFSARGSYSNGSSSDGFIARRPSQWEGQPPPPPPRDFLKRMDGAGDSPSPTAMSPTEVMQHPGTAISGEYTAKDLEQTQKRKDGKKPEPLRQEDDVTPRFKRSQPQVAEAYSRRW